MNRPVTLKVNGQEVDLNPFVERIIAHVVEGLVAALDRVPQPASDIEIRLGPASNVGSTTPKEVGKKQP